ncbi:uncharacterized protein LOC117660328 isoform X1 [Pantherophis guttatus]|uniref:Uncharacterized protein LOC117660328 isoform X1 n=1 Tax=Pantherophis guttatus TaxID=94885 RepID=A0ABM3Z1E4_PANGU|nr:uncharacterized protein LOC117660328 isoform X1 [Pantherophis guttatus]
MPRPNNKFTRFLQLLHQKPTYLLQQPTPSQQLFRIKLQPPPPLFLLSLNHLQHLLSHQTTPINNLTFNYLSLLTPSILKTTRKQTEPLEDLSATQKSLRLQIEELRGTLACLDSENKMFLKDKECIKEQQKSLRNTMDYLKSTIEHLQITVEDIRERLEQANTVIQDLALQNKSLVKANEDLNQEMHAVTSQVAVFRDDKPA